MAKQTKQTQQPKAAIETPTAEVQTPKVAIQLQHGKEYTLIGTGTHPEIIKGIEYTESGSTAEVLINKGFATLKTT